jgi:hypothetical protein
MLKEIILCNMEKNKEFKMTMSEFIESNATLVDQKTLIDHA